jgi:hypothetical protein
LASREWEHHVVYAVLSSSGLLGRHDVGVLQTSAPAVDSIGVAVASAAAA